MADNLSGEGLHRGNRCEVKINKTTLGGSKPSILSSTEPSWHRRLLTRRQLARGIIAAHSPGFAVGPTRLGKASALLEGHHGSTMPANDGTGNTAAKVGKTSENKGGVYLKGEREIGSAVVELSWVLGDCYMCTRCVGSNDH